MHSHVVADLAAVPSAGTDFILDHLHGISQLAPILLVLQSNPVLAVLSSWVFAFINTPHDLASPADQSGLYPDLQVQALKAVFVELAGQAAQVKFGSVPPTI